MKKYPVPISNIYIPPTLNERHITEEIVFSRSASRGTLTGLLDDSCPEPKNT
jgi:hypothetical protein